MAPQKQMRFQGEKVERLRTYAGKTRQDFATAAHTNREQIRRVELGITQPSPPLALAIAIALDIDVRELYEETSLSEQAS